MKPRIIKTRLDHSASILVASIAALLASQSAHAANKAWSTAPASLNFTGTNWTASNVPGVAAVTLADTDTLFFGTSSITTLTNDEPAGFNLAGITFNAGAAAFTINGVNSNNLTGNITNSSTNLQTVNGPLALTATRTVTVTAAGGNITLGGAISGLTFGLTTAGTGTLTLNGISTYTGATTVATGTTLNLDFSTATAPTTATNIIFSANTINLSGGTLAVKGGGSGATNSQTFTNTTLTANTASSITANLNGGTALGLALNGITRNAQSTVDVTLGGANVTTTTAQAPLNGILVNSSNVAYATADGGTTWLAKATGGSPFALTAYTGYVTGGANYASANNVDVTDGDSVSGVTVNTLRFNSATDGLTLAGINTVSTGGILVTPTTAATVTGGTLQAGGGKELVIMNYGTLNVGSIIANNATASLLTIAGPGTTTLSTANTFTGQTTLLGGSLKLTDQLALQNSTLQYNTGSALVFDQSVAANAFTLGGLNTNNNIALVNNAAAAINLTVGNNNSSTTISGALSGTGGSLTKAGTGSLNLGGVNTYSGATTVNGGSLVLTSGAALSNTSSIVLGVGTTLSLARNSTQSSILGSGVISGAGGVIENINNPNQSPTMDRANTYTGPTSFNIRGGLTAGVVSTYDVNGNQTSGAFGVNSAIKMTGGGAILVLNGKSNQVGSLSGNSGNVYLGNATLTTGGDNTSTSFGVTISDTYLGNNSAGGGAVSIGGKIVKIGTGTQTFTANNLYGGATTIAGGTLSISTIANGGAQTTGSTSGSSTTLTVASTAGIVVGQTVLGAGIQNASTTVTAIGVGSVTLSAAVTVPANSGLSFGNGNGIGTSSNAASNLVINNGTLKYTGAAASTDRLFTIAGATGTLDASGTGALSFTNTGAIVYGTVDQARTLTLTGSPNTAAGTLAPLIADNGAGAVSVVKSGAGTWTLTNTNTYTGTTSVTDGTLALSGTSIPDGNSLSITGTGTVTVTGTETVGSLTLGATTYASGTFNSGNSGGYITSGTIQVGSPTGGYASWATGKGLDGTNNGATQDPNNNGISNLLEYVLNGDPKNAESPAAILPTLDSSGTTFVFTYHRLDASLADVAQTFQYGSDLAGWTSIVVPTASGTVGAATITVTDASPADTVVISIPKTESAGGKLFGRLQAVK